MNYNLVLYVVVIVSAIFARISQLLAKDKENTYKLNKVFYIFSFLCLFIFIAFRECGVGIDDYAYRKIFVEVNTYGVINRFISTTMEPGYLLLNYIVGIFTDDFQIMMAVASFISLFFVYKALEYERKNINYLLAIFIFGTMIYPYYFGILRLSIAVSICFYALKYLFEGNRKKFNIYVILAASFHYSALVILLLNILIKKNISNKNIRKFYTYAILLLPIAFILVSKLIVPLLGSRYANYIIKSNLSISIGDFDKVPIIMCCILFYKNMERITKNSKLYIVLYSMAMILSIYSSFINFGRIQWYFNILICIIFPILVKGISKSIKTHKFNLVIIPLIVFYCILFCNKITDPSAKNVNFDIYKNVLFK